MGCCLTATSSSTKSEWIFKEKKGKVISGVSDWHYNRNAHCSFGKCEGVKRTRKRGREEEGR